MRNENNHFCDFSDFGAIQLRTDFGALRTWIANNETLKEESRRYLLLVDSIRQCEGVARLLLSRPGDLVDVKPSKNKVAPLGIFNLFFDRETRSIAVLEVVKLLGRLGFRLYSKSCKKCFLSFL